jgi:hypothetical protein
MRLRQIALIAHQVAPLAASLGKVFGLRSAFSDPAVGVFGLSNVVMPVGGEFLEVLEALRPDTAGGRYLVRRGGDAGYMVILQDQEAHDHRARLVAAGVRVIAASGPDRYRFTHFHPADCAGVLLSIDSVFGEDWRDPLCDWPPAGPHWPAAQSQVSLGIPSVTIQARDPQGGAALWSRLLEQPCQQEGDTFTLCLEPGVIRFVPPVDKDGTGIVAMEIKVIDPAAAVQRARAAGLPIVGGSVRICGVDMTPVN